ncbi:MAG: SIMPL domain-containing protein [bacterium]|nr:SIMPL domain-containing protein [bacterium]
MNNDNLKNNAWKVGLAAGILLSIFLLVISVKQLKSIAYVGKDTPVFNSITVSGTGEVISIPDIATFSFSVTENAKNVDEAQAKATEKINKAIQALKDNGVEDRDIKTLSYNISPHYEYVNEAPTVSPYLPRPPRQILNGYDVSQTVQVKVRDLSKAGSLFSTIGSLNVQNVNGLNFSIDDIDAVKAEARQLAIENAKEKAKSLSKQLGVRTVRVTSFYENSDEIPPFYREGMGGDMMTLKGVSPVPEIPAGEQKVVSRVSITYEIR